MSARAHNSQFSANNRNNQWHVNWERKRYPNSRCESIWFKQFDKLTLNWNFMKSRRVWVRSIGLQSIEANKKRGLNPSIYFAPINPPSFAFHANFQVRTKMLESKETLRLPNTVWMLEMFTQLYFSMDSSVDKRISAQWHRMCSVLDKFLLMDSDENMMFNGVLLRTAISQRF